MPRGNRDGTPARPPNKRRLTELFVTTVKPAKLPFMVWDEKRPGLALSVQPTGRRAWKFVYRFGGKPRDG